MSDFDTIPKYGATGGTFFGPTVGKEGPELFDPAAAYELGDEVICTPRKVITLTGLAWLWAKLTGKPTQWTEDGDPQVYRCVG